MTIGPIETCLLYEGDPQILSGNVFKMWYTERLEGPDRSRLNYAESYDAINWTKYGSNPIVASSACHGIIKVESTYFLYHNPYDGSKNLVRLHSSDGLAWTSDGVVMTPSGLETELYSPFVWIEATTWNMIYEYYASGDGRFYLARAHSSDGLSWTKDGALVGTGMGAGNPWATKIGSTYYLWHHGGTPAVYGNGILKHKSTDLQNWTQVPTCFVSKTYGMAAGNPFLVEALGNVYLFHSITTPDETTSSISVGLLREKSLVDIVELKES